MTIYTDKNYVVCKKPAGVSSQLTSDKHNMLSLISESLGISNDEIYPIHRLDVAVGGTILYALNKESASKLSQMMTERTIKKQYLAIVHGKITEKSKIFTDLLFKDSSKNKSFVVKKARKGVKEASLEYTLLDSVKYNGDFASLLKITLHTGRSHQIRVQFSHRKFPLFGDRRYGSGKDDCSVALWSNTISFLSPFDNAEKFYTSLPDINEFPWNLFDKSLYVD